MAPDADRSYIARLAVLAFVLSCPAAQTLTQAEVQEHAVLHGSAQGLFRDYALAACLGTALPQIGVQTMAAASEYIQYGYGPAEAYQEVTAAARDFLKPDYVSQTGADLSVMKCIDFVQSRELAVLVRKCFPVRKTSPR